MEKSLKLLHFVINLERSVSRRENIQRQADELGLDVRFVKAVAGNELDVARLEHYDRDRRMSMYTWEMAPNEHACVMSHLKAMREFMASDADYCIISEDDVLFPKVFKSNVEFLLNKTSGWEFIKLFSGDCRRYDVLPGQEGNPVALQFPKKFPWGGVCNLYSRKAAELILKGFEGYWMGFDVQLAQICLSAGLPCCGVTPDVADTENPSNEQSEIDADGSRYAGKVRRSRTLLQWMRYRFYVWGMARGKQKMRAMLSRCLKVER